MTRWTLAAIFVVLLASRLAHLNIVWVEEGYPTAAAIQMLDSGKTLYKDIWFDKPAGTAYLYYLWGARTGLALRLADALFLFACCLLTYGLGRALWGRELEGLVAAALLALYLTFGIPAAVMALAPDLALVLPHIAAVWLAVLKRPALAGAVAAIGFWFNTKALFVLASCAVFLAPGLDWLRLLGGFAAVTSVQFGLLLAQGAFAAYWDQVWRWGGMYARDSFVEQPWLYGFRQTLNWCGFQAAALVGAVVALYGKRRGPFPDGRGSEGLVLWLVLCAVPVALGLRFFPRYYFQILPVAVLLAGRGFAISARPIRLIIVLLALIPVVRFGPRYVSLTADLLAHRSHQWSDLALEQDSEQVAEALRAQPRGALFVWGYRPDIYALTRLPAATQFLDSQPISGVLADRHLTSSKVSAPEWAVRNVGVIEQAQPTYIVDGLGRLNPSLAVPLPAGYEIIADTGRSIVYRNRNK